MRTGELTEIASRPAHHAQNLAIECHLEDAAWVCRLPNEQQLIGTGGNADRVGSSDYLLEAITCRRSAIDSPRRRIRRHIDRKHALEIAIGIKDLDAMVRAITNINIVVEVDGDRVWQVELTGAGTLRSPRLHPVAVLVDFGDTRVDVTVSDVDVALRVPGDIGRLTEKAIHGRKRRIRMSQWLGTICRFLAAAKH